MTTQTLREAVASQIAQINPVVGEKVVEHFVQTEINKRADAIVKGLDTLSNFQRERAKLAKPDQVSYNADRTVAAETYSKAKLDEIEKLDKKIEKLEKAINKAIDGDMGDLYNLNKGGGDQ